MDFCVLIELSKKKISFLYNRSDGESKLTPFVGDGQALPLAIFCQGNDIQIGQYAINEALNMSPYAYTDVFKVMRNVGTYKYRGEEFPYNTLLSNVIQKYLSYFFDSVLIGQQGRLEQNVATMPLCFMFNSDVDENERLFVKECFARNGYGNVAVTDYDQLVIEASDYPTPNVICATSDGLDMFVGIYQTDGAKHLSSFIIKGHGKDPRIEATVDRLWESIGYDSYYLDPNKERQILTRIAENFLSSGNYEFQDRVLFSDGVSRECFISMSQVDTLMYKTDGKIISDIRNKLFQLGISTKDCTVVLKGKAANNSFFEKVFKEEFLVKHVNDSFRSKVLKQLLDDIKECGYCFSSAPSEMVSDKKESTKQEPVISPALKRTVKVQIANIKAKLRNNDRKGAMTAAEQLLSELTEQNVHDWDVEIRSLLANMPITGAETKTDEEPIKVKTEEESHTKIVDPKAIQREVRITLAEVKGKIRAKDYKTAESVLNVLQDRLHGQGVYEYDSQMADVRKEILPTPQSIVGKKPVVPQSLKTESKTESMSPAEKLLRQGKFVDAKRAFAAEGNSMMAQACSDLIKSKRTIEQFKMGLEAAKRNKNRTTISNAIRELERSQKLYKKYEIEDQELNALINNYKSI